MTWQKVIGQPRNGKMINRRKLVWFPLSSICCLYQWIGNFSPECFALAHTPEKPTTISEGWNRMGSLEEQSTRSEYRSVRAAKPLIASAAAFRANTISKNKAHSQSSCLLPSFQNLRLVHFHGLDICLMFFWLYYCFFCVLYFCRESGGDVTKFWGQPSGADCEWDKSERASPSICVTECIPLDCSRIPLIFLAFKLFHIIIERLFNKLYWLVCRQGVSFSVSPFFFFCLGCVFLQSVYTSCTRNARLMGWILLEMMMISMSALVGVIMKGTDRGMSCIYACEVWAYEFVWQSSCGR